MGLKKYFTNNLRHVFISIYIYFPLLLITYKYSFLFPNCDQSEVSIEVPEDSYDLLDDETGVVDDPSPQTLDGSLGTFSIPKKKAAEK